MTPAEVRAFTPLVNACVRRFAAGSLPASIDRDDLTQTAWQALIVAHAAYDRSRNDSLEAWLWLRMRGAVLNEIERHRFGKRGSSIEPVSLDRGARINTEAGPEWIEDRGGASRFYFQDERTDVQGQVEARAGLADVLDAFRSLPDSERFVMAGVAVGRTEAEIAADLGIGIRDVRRIKFSARCLIRSALRISDQVAA